ncbi:hypothetical protein [Staphylococcus epidermidis]|uniref:hypothetical protein n=2 Tax=Staphylococcus epidermidis TaxID=1282 RepID=UPI0030ECE0D9
MKKMYQALKKKGETMKIKTFATFTHHKLDSQVNDFLEKENIKILEIQTNSNWLYISTTIIYKNLE